jgi:hypothetical protein
MSGVRARIAAPRTKLRQAFDLNRRRRIEIERHALNVGAAQTEDLSRWLIAWIWHNPSAKDQVGAVIECARRMGRDDMSPAAAREIIDEAQSTPKCRKADSLAAWLGIKFAERQYLHIRTIGSVNVKKRARTELRKRSKRVAQESRRRAQGVQSRVQYENNSLSATRPWEKLNMSRRTWYRRQNQPPIHSPAAVGTSACPITFLIPKHTPVPLERKKGDFRGSAAHSRKEAGVSVVYELGSRRQELGKNKGVEKIWPRSRIEDRYAQLPEILRMQALGLAV